MIEVLHTSRRGPQPPTIEGCHRLAVAPVLLAYYCAAATAEHVPGFNAEARHCPEPTIVAPFNESYELIDVTVVVTT
jgi:hypothetical protein